MGEGRLRRELRRKGGFGGKPWFSSESFTGLRAAEWQPEPKASGATLGDGRLRRETVEGFPLFVKRRGPSRRRAARSLRNLCRLPGYHPPRAVLVFIHVGEPHTE